MIRWKAWQQSKTTVESRQKLFCSQRSSFIKVWSKEQSQRETTRLRSIKYNRSTKKVSLKLCTVLRSRKYNRSTKKVSLKLCTECMRNIESPLLKETEAVRSQISDKICLKPSVKTEQVKGTCFTQSEAIRRTVPPNPESCSATDNRTLRFACHRTMWSSTWRKINSSFRPLVSTEPTKRAPSTKLLRLYAVDSLSSIHLTGTP